jgi:hypothetical protein
MRNRLFQVFAETRGYKNLEWQSLLEESDLER